MSADRDGLLPAPSSPRGTSGSANPASIATSPRSSPRTIPTSQFRTNNPFIHRISSNAHTVGAISRPDSSIRDVDKALPGTPVPGTPPLHIQPRIGSNNGHRAVSGGKANVSPSGIRWSPRNQPQKQQRHSSSPTSRSASPQPPSSHHIQRSRIPSPAPHRNISHGSPRASPRNASLNPRSLTSPPPAQAPVAGGGATSPKPPRKIPQGPTRRPVPALSPDLHLSPPGSGLLRKLSIGNKGGGLRPQPSAPVLRSEQADTRAREGRKRANSTRSAAIGKKYGAGPQLGLGPPATISGAGAGTEPRQYTAAFSLFSRTARFADPPVPEAAQRSRTSTDDRPVSPHVPITSDVPQHIRLRLRLFSRLASTLDIEQAEVSRLIDVPGLLARVDKAYERFQGNESVGREVGESNVPLPGGTSSIQGPTSLRTHQAERRAWWMFPQGDGVTPGFSSSNSFDLGLGSRGMASSFSLSNLGLGLGLGLNSAKERDKEKKERDEKDKETSKRGQGVLGKLKMFGRKSLDEARPTSLFESSRPGEDAYSRMWDLPIFGVSLVDLPADGWCTIHIGSQDHEIPIPVFVLIEEIYRRGMSVPGIFRLAGKDTEVARQYDICNAPPFYGEGADLSSPNIHSLSNVLKRFMRDLPEPVLDESLFHALWEWCCLPDFPTPPLDNARGLSAKASPARIRAAVLLLQMLPPQHFSLIIYSLAFVVQLQHFSGNRLTLDAISIIFGPALLASRSKGVPGLGPGSKGIKHDPEVVSSEVDQSQKALGWLVHNWPEISKSILESPFPPVQADKQHTLYDRLPNPALLSPIDLRGKDDSPFALTRSERSAKSLDLDRLGEAVWDADADTDDSGSLLPYVSDITPSRASSEVKPPLRAVASSVNLYQAHKATGELTKAPKRSASFTNLTSVFKKGIGASKEVKMVAGGKNTHPSPTLSDYSTIIKTPSTPSEVIDLVPPNCPRPSPSLLGTKTGSSLEKSSINPQITNVLGSLQDLLLSKDRQIERDARELAILRHTLLEMDEKLKLQAKTQSLPDAAEAMTVPAPASGPEIKITASPSVAEFNDTLLADLQSQLATALSALAQSRETTKQKDRQLVDLHTALARAESTRKVELSKLEVALAMETARCKGLREERDLARDRLDKVKKELFAVG